MIKNEMIRIQLLRKEKPINTTTDYIYNINHDKHFFIKSYHGNLTYGLGIRYDSSSCNPKK